MPTNEWNFGRSIFFTGMVLLAGLLVDELVGCMSAPAQQRSGFASASTVAVPGTADELIRQMSATAAIIFAGEVVEVRRPSGTAGSVGDGAAGVVETDFRVDQAVLGVRQNSIYTLREWSGLWAGGNDRYHSGQRLLMLLHAPNAAGLTTPVRGVEGAIPLRGAGAAPGPYESSSTASQWMVDVRWLKAQTSRQQVQTGVHSELTAGVPENFNTLLVHALPGPWIVQSNPALEVESLAHVLGICVGPGEPHDAP